MEDRRLRAKKLEDQRLRAKKLEPLQRLRAMELDTGPHSLFALVGHLAGQGSKYSFSRLMPWCTHRLAIGGLALAFPLRGCCLLYSVALLNSVAASHSQFSGRGGGEDQSQGTERLRAKRTQKRWSKLMHVLSRRSGKDRRAKRV